MQREHIPSQDHRTCVCAPPSSVCCGDTQLMKEVNAELFTVNREE